MTIDPKALLPGTVVQVSMSDEKPTEESRDLLAFVCYPEDDDVLYTRPEGMGGRQVGGEIERVFVPVPDGMTVEDAQQALAEHVAWVPLPGGVTEKHVGARARHVMHDVELLGVIGRITDQGCAATPEGLNLASVEYGDWFIHPDDVPIDPDAELIEAMAQKMADRHEYPEWQGLFESDRDLWRSHARAALAVVREHEAGQR